MLSKRFFNSLLIQDVRSLFVSVDKGKVLVPWNNVNMIKTTFEQLFGKSVDLIVSPAYTLAMSTKDIQ